MRAASLDALSFITMKKKHPNVEAFSLPPLMSKQITSLIDSGYYSSRSDVVKDAIRHLIESKKNLGIASSVSLYKEKLISKEEALMISGKTEKEFDKILRGKK